MSRACNWGEHFFKFSISKDFHSSLIKDMCSGCIRTAAMSRNDQRFDTKSRQVQGSRRPRGASTNDENGKIHDDCQALNSGRNRPRILWTIPILETPCDMKSKQRSKRVVISRSDSPLCQQG